VVEPNIENNDRSERVRQAWISSVTQVFDWHRIDIPAELEIADSEISRGADCRIDFAAAKRNCPVDPIATWVS